MSIVKISADFIIEGKYRHPMTLQDTSVIVELFVHYTRKYYIINSNDDDSKFLFNGEAENFHGKKRNPEKWKAIARCIIEAVDTAEKLLEENK